MAKCEVCQQEMNTADGCVQTIYVLKDRTRVLALPYVNGWGDGKEDRCGDCNCKLGQLHHNGCDLERCPICLRQAISCDHLAGAKLYEVKEK
jgi:hypothetical protein